MMESGDSFNIDTEPTSRSSTYATIDQIKANFLSRWIEISRFLGALFQGSYFAAVSTGDLNSDEVTADVQIGNVITNGAGFICGLLLHYFFQKYYRTGHYELSLGSAKPSAETISQMKKDEILIYQDEVTGKLHYVVKGLSTSFKEGVIDEAADGEEEKEDSDGGSGSDSENELESTRLTLAKRHCDELKILIANLQANPKPTISDKCKTAFLKYTAQKIDTYDGRISTNPMYRNFKDLANFGWQLGATICNFIGILDPNKKRLFSYILSDVCCLVLGSFAIPYWYIREKILKIPPGTKHKYAVTGIEGWSKYTRTALAFGTAIGQAIGGILAVAMQNASAAVSSFSIAFWGGIVGVGSFLLGLIGVPLVNWVSSKLTKNRRRILASNSKNAYRNNYTRSGMILGAAFGALFGLLIGNWSFGFILSGTIFSAIGSVIGGIGLSIYGRKIQKKMHPLPPGSDLFLMSPEASDNQNSDENCLRLYHKSDHLVYYINDREYEIENNTLSTEIRNLFDWAHLNSKGILANGQLNARQKQACKVLLTETCSRGHTLAPTKTEEDEDCENNWDYVSRSSASVFSFIGAAVVCAINPAAALLLVPIGTAIAGGIGWFLGLLIMRRARRIPGHEQEKKSDILPWTQRITTGANMGSIIGGAIGIVVGLTGFVLAGPAGIILAVSLFGAIGAVLGGIWGVLYDKKARDLIWKGIKGIFTGHSSAEEKKPLIRVSTSKPTGHSPTPSSGNSSPEDPNRLMSTAARTRKALQEADSTASFTPSPKLADVVSGPSGGTATDSTASLTPSPESADVVFGPSGGTAAALARVNSVPELSKCGHVPGGSPRIFVKSPQLNTVKSQTGSPSLRSHPNLRIEIPKNSISIH